MLATGLLAQASSSAEAGGPAIRLARLSGDKEVPGPGVEGGTGVATVIVHPGQGRLCFAIAVEGIELPAVAAHVHVGASDVAGPVVVGLTPPDATGSSAGCVSADPALQGDQADPEGVLRERPHDVVPGRRRQRSAAQALRR